LDGSPAQTQVAICVPRLSSSSQVSGIDGALLLETHRPEPLIIYKRTSDVEADVRDASVADRRIE
jgi:hypothetical protein